MTRYLIEPRNLAQNVRGKYNQKPLDHAKQSHTDALRTT